MKKIIPVFCLVILTLFTSCKDKYRKDAYGCFISYMDAKEEASEKKLPVLAIITQEEGEQGGGSDFFIKNILTNKEFKTYAKDKFILYRMDCSQSTFQKSVFAEDGTDKEKEESLFFSDAIKEGFDLMANLGVDYTPYFAFVLPQGYIVNEINYSEDKMDTKTFCSILDYFYQEVEMNKHLVELIETSDSDSEKLTSIEALYETTPVKFRGSLIDLARLAVSLDPENKTGKMGKYLFSIADTDASELCINQQDYEGAIKKYMDLLDTGYLSNEEKIQCYYMSAYVLERFGSIDDPRLLEYLKKALELNPEEEMKLYLENGIEYFSNTVKSLQE